MDDNITIPIDINVSCNPCFSINDSPREIRRYHWDEPYLYKHYFDGIYRQCVAESKTHEILYHCHGSINAGHFVSFKTVSKILQAVFWWPTMFRDAETYVAKCDHCQRRGKTPRETKWKKKFILEVEVFDCWSIDFMGPFPSLHGNKYILVGKDYVSKLVEAIATPKNDASAVVKLFKSINFF
ncbi:hypothetical protein N665_0173s0015 [Sinapis alba]|nr:hypothetical protein N665_0173s0015 [Sinapis alba]